MPSNNIWGRVHLCSSLVQTKEYFINSGTVTCRTVLAGILFQGSVVPMVLGDVRGAVRTYGFAARKLRVNLRRIDLSREKSMHLAAVARSAVMYSLPRLDLPPRALSKMDRAFPEAFRACGKSSFCAFFPIPQYQCSISREHLLAKLAREKVDSIS